MITIMMSLSARRELPVSIWQKYQHASRMDKGKILDGFVCATGYGRKHAIQLLIEQLSLKSQSANTVR